MRTFHLRILAAERTFYDGACASLTVPTIDGSYGLMALHENVVIAIVPGELTLHTADGEEQIAAVSEGMLKMVNNEALVLVDTIERPEEIDLRRAERNAAESEAALHEKQSEQERALVMARMARAMSRVQVKRHGKYTGRKIAPVWKTGCDFLRARPDSPRFAQQSM